MKISVIIPTHNRPECLSRSLKSVANQTLLPYEIIVVDDGSKKAVSKSIFEIFPKTMKCILLRNDIPRGASHARNSGVKASSCDYLAFLDDDDEFRPDKIEIIAKNIKLHPKVDIFYHPARIHMVNEGVSYLSKPCEAKKNDKLFQTLLVQNQIGGTPMSIINRKSLIKVGLFDEELPALEDYELWLRLAKYGYIFQLEKEPVTNCYYTTQTVSVSKNLERNERAMKLIEKKYANDYMALSESELRRHEYWKIRMTIHKALLNNQLAIALKSQLRLLTHAPSLANLGSLLILCLGPKVTFKLKARFN